MAGLQRHPGVKVICFFQPEHREKLAAMQARFPLFETIPFPVDPAWVEAALVRALAQRPGAAGLAGPARIPRARSAVPCRVT